MQVKADSTTTKTDSSHISGAGSEVTALAESLQVYACATRQHLGKDLGDISLITEKTIVDSYANRTLKQCMAGLDEGWFYSVINTANALFKDIPGATRGKKYRFYRGGKLVYSIYDEWRRLKSGSGIVSNDKWNPADIWMIKKTYKHQYGFNTLTEYNRYMYNVFNSADCIGISLKKLIKNAPAHSKIFNVGQPPTVEYTGIRLHKNLTETKDIYIRYNEEGRDNEIQLRNFSSRPVRSSWQGEIKGKASAGGKIGGNIILKSAVDTGVNPQSLVWPNKAPIDKPRDSDFIEFATAFKKLSGSIEKLENLITQAKERHRYDKAWWFSKYMGIMFVSEVIKQKKMDALCSYIFQYASSATKNSSVFIKYS